MHPLMRPVLLRAARMNALMNNAEAHPPHVEIAQPVDRLGSERHAVVGANRAPEPVLAKYASKTGRAVAVSVVSSP